MDDPNFPCPKCGGTDLRAGTSSYEFQQRPSPSGAGTMKQLVAATRNFTCGVCGHQFAVRHHYDEPKH